MRTRDSLIRERKEAFRDARLIIIASEKLDINVNNRWPQTLGTLVYLMAESIIRDSHKV